MNDLPDPGHWDDVVLEGSTYKQVSTDGLRRIAAGGDREAARQLQRRAGPPDDAFDPDAVPHDDMTPGGMFADTVVDDEPYWSLPKGLLRNLAADGDAGAVDELIRRGLPIVGP